MIKILKQKNRAYFVFSIYRALQDKMELNAVLKLCGFRGKLSEIKVIHKNIYQDWQLCKFYTHKKKQKTLISCHIILNVMTIADIIFLSKY